MKRNESRVDNQGMKAKRCIGFGRVDRISILRPQVCQHCGGTHLTSKMENVEIQQVAQLVANPIEIALISSSSVLLFRM
jgi:hypothetical protein